MGGAGFSGDNGVEGEQDGSNVEGEAASGRMSVSCVLGWLTFNFPDEVSSCGIPF